MIADIGTRKGAIPKEVNHSSTWINGFSWMQLDSTKFPMMAIEGLNKSQLCEVQKEHNIEVHCNMLNDNKILEEVKQRYQCSQCLIVPNLHTFKSVDHGTCYEILHNSDQ